MKTALWVCSLRAEEQNHPDPLFRDPYSALISDQSGDAVLKLMQSRRSDPEKVPLPYAVVRTRYFDDFIETQISQGKKQVILVGSGLDTRPWRIPWPEEITVFELDRKEVFDLKLSGMKNRRASCNHIQLPCELGVDDFSGKLCDAGFRPEEPSIWVFEGISMYLDRELFFDLLEQVNRLSTKGSSFICDVFNSEVMTHPTLSRLMTGLANDGSPINCGIDEPTKLLPDWSVTSTQPGEPEASYGRWPLPVPPAGVSAPRAYFVTALKG